MKHVTIHTDGACEPNPGPGGWACVLECTAEDGSKKRMELSGYVPPPSTNNRCEMAAVIEALSALKEPCDVRLITDSMVCVYALRPSKPRKVDRRKNLDLVAKIEEQKKRHRIAPEWIKGHAGHPENERCDQLAMEMIRSKNNPCPAYSCQPEQAKGRGNSDVAGDGDMLELSMG